MARKINRILIPIFILLLLLCVSQRTSAEQSFTNIYYLPQISYNPAGWIGPYGGTVVPIAYDPSNPQIVYAGSYGAGVYKSQDGGSTWFSASQGITNPSIYSLAIDPTHPSTVYAGTYKSQVYKTTDGGNSWFWTGTGMQAEAIVYSIAIDPANPLNLYAATRGVSNNNNPPWNGVLYKSTNAGQSWQPSLLDLGGENLQDWVYSVKVNPLGYNPVLIAAHESGPFRSDNYGENWYPINSGIQDYSGRAIALGEQPGYLGTFYYGVWHIDTIYKSTNGGGKWRVVNSGIPEQQVYSIALDPFDVDNVFLGTFTDGVLKSTTGGASWQQSGLVNEEIYTVTINPYATSNLLAGTSGSGIFRTWDSGQTWYKSSTGITNVMVTSVVVSPTDPDSSYVSTFGDGVYQYNYRSRIWAEINNGLTDTWVLDLVMDPAHPGWLYALTRSNGLFKNDLTTTNGWIFVGFGLPQTYLSPQIYPSDHPLASLEMQEAAVEGVDGKSSTALAYFPLVKMVFAPSNPLIVYIGTTGAGVYRSSNGGQSWTQTSLGSGSIASLAVDRFNENLVYAITTTPGGFFVSTNGGQSWSNPISARTFYSLAVSPLQSGVVFAGTDLGIYRYASGTWSPSPIGLPDQAVTALAFDESQPGRIIAGSTTGAFYSLDDGHNWDSVSVNLDGQTIKTISIDPFYPNLVYFGTKAHSIFLYAFGF